MFAFLSHIRRDICETRCLLRAEVFFWWVLLSEACGREVTDDSCQKTKNVPVECVSHSTLNAGSGSKMLLVVYCLVCVAAWNVLI